MGAFGDFMTGLLLFLQQLGSALAPAVVPQTGTPVPTFTRRATLTPTVANTRRPTSTPTITRSPTITRTPVATARPTNTRPTITPTPSITRRPSMTWTPTLTPRLTATESATPTQTNTRRPTSTTTPTNSPRPTITPIPSSTARPTSTPTFTWTPRPTATETPTFSPRPTRTDTPIPTETFTRPPTLTATQSRIPSNTRTPQPTATFADPTATATPKALDALGLAAIVGTGPAQKLPSALLVYPLVEADNGGNPRDTRVEIVNLTSAGITVTCAYIESTSCGEIDFGIFLTANQPLSWMVSQGYRSFFSGTAIPPFRGSGELKCAVVPGRPDLSAHNALQGRALVSNVSPTPGPSLTAGPETVGYTAIGFRRLTPGDFSGVFDLDGVTYEQCPQRLHFHVLTSQPGANSEVLLVPCTENVIFGPTSTQISLRVINEFEQSLSGGLPLQCTVRRRFSSISALNNLGTDTAHLVVQGVDVPVIGLVIDRFNGVANAPSVSANEPYLEGGASATIQLP